jgi:hypothetical protein
MGRRGEVAACGEEEADVGRAGPIGPDPRKDSNESLNFEFQLKLDFGKTWRNSSRRFRRNKLMKGKKGHTNTCIK